MQEFERLLTGFEFTEGPIWNPQDQSLIFSDILGNSLFQWSQDGDLKKLRRNSYMANGNTYDRRGCVVTCEHATSRVTRTDFAHHGDLEILATHYDGKQLNSPNDIVCKRDGNLYFSDPTSGRSEGFGVPRQQELDFQGVYRLNPDNLSLSLLVNDFSKPNGLCFSLDEKHLYVNDSDRGHIRIFELTDQGSLINGRVWIELTVDGIGVADGMKIDQAGNIYCCGPGGIHLLDVDANYLGLVKLPEQAANLTWGGQDLCSLYIAATTSIYQCRTKIPGAGR